MEPQSRPPLRQPAQALGMGGVADGDEPDPHPGRGGAGGGAGDPAVPLEHLLARPAAAGLLRQPDRHRLGRGPGGAGADPALRHGGGRAGLGHRLRHLADQRDLLPGLGAARLAARVALGAAAGPCVRGHARSLARPGLRHRPFPRRGRPQRDLARPRQRRLPPGASAPPATAAHCCSRGNRQPREKEKGGGDP